MPETSIVILTFNSATFIKLCLDSVFSQVYKDFEVVVVDNGSKDCTVGFIKENYPQIILIENKENLGACKARNQGIGVAKGKWVLAMDCDTVLENNFLTKISQAIKITPLDVGMIQPKILNWDKKTISSCGIYLSWLARFHDIGKGQLDLGQFDKSAHIFGSSSAAAIFKREMLEDIKEKTGYFDESFFFLAEDVDLSCRAQRKGWKALYYPEAISYHNGNSSTLSKPLRQFLCWRNRKFLLKKYRNNKFQLAIIYLFYDFTHLAFLFLTNSYVRNAILKKNNRKINGEIKIH